MSTTTKGGLKYSAAKFALAAVSVALGAFGVAGWVVPAADAAPLSPEWCAAAVLGALTGAAACIIPLTVPALGRSIASAALILPLGVFGAVAAYSTHHAVETLVEAPRIAAHMAHADEAVTEAGSLLAKARADLDALPALVIPEGAGPNGTAARAQAWALQQAPLAEAVETAKADLAAAEAGRDMARAAYRPLVDDKAVWIVGALIDLAIALGIWALERTELRHAPRVREPAALDDAMAAIRAQEAEQAAAAQLAREAEIAAEAAAAVKREARNRKARERRKAEAKAKAARQRIPMREPDTGPGLRLVFDAAGQ